MAIGFDPKAVEALVLFGYPLEGLTFAECVGVEKAVARLGSGLLAAPHGDLSETGAPNAQTPNVRCAFTFAVGTVVGRARTAATPDATTQSATITNAVCTRARASFEAARPLIDAELATLGITPPADPGLYVVAAGPSASARLDGDPGSTVQEIPETGPATDPVQRLDVSSREPGPAARVRLDGLFTLSARYD